MGYESIVGIGVGAHGITDIESSVSLFSFHFPSWGSNVPLKDLIAEASGYAGPLAVDNQIRFQAYAELRSGKAQGFEDVVFIEEGKGLVAGNIENGGVQRGTHCSAGEIGHMPLDPYDADRCSCGSRGCFEVLVPYGRVVGRYQELSGRPIADAEMPDTFRSVFRFATSGDEAALRCLDESAAWFASGLANVILVDDPEIFVFQGLYTDAGPYFLARLKDHLSALAVPGITKKVVLAYSALGADACLIGATGYLIDEYFRRTLVLIE